MDKYLFLRRKSSTEKKLELECIVGTIKYTKKIKKNNINITTNTNLLELISRF
jgi:hypothetical protein